MNPRNQCIAPEFISNRCSANRTGRSRVISCHSRDIGVACLQFCNHYKDNGQGHVLYHDLEVYPVYFDKKWLRPNHVVVVAKRLKVLATCREIW
jgi:hypothetical protein